MNRNKRTKNVKGNKAANNLQTGIEAANDSHPLNSMDNNANIKNRNKDTTTME